MTVDDWIFGGSWPYEPHWYETADGRLHYVDEGPRDAPPVVLVHGDSHYFRIDKPFKDSKTRRMLENFTRVETFGENDIHWVHVFVDPKTMEKKAIPPEARERLASYSVES